MEPVDEDDPGAVPTFDQPDDRSAVNALILDYYKKFGRKRDLEQFFSLSTAQGDIRDPSGLFWRRMKAMNSSSDSGDKPSESSAELCRISIKCSIPEQSSSQDEKSKPKSDTESPPIITEESPAPLRHSDDESVKSEDNHSQKSCDATLDTSTNKPLSPTSSVTSHRKLEWDSLADVGYANESDRKASSSSLSTLERLAILQQYSNSDKEHTNIGPPTAHSTFLDSKNSVSCKSKSNKKNLLKNIKEIHNKDIVEVNVPHTSDSPPKSISVNLTKHISFNVEKDGAITVVDSKDKQLTAKSPDKISKLSEIPEVRFDKEIQTSLPKSNSGGSHSRQSSKSRYGSQMYGGQAPVLISLNSLKRRIKRRKTRTARKRSNTRKTSNLKKEIPIVPVHEKSGEQVSEAESFEYMPGHIYNQNQMIDDHQKTRNSAGNKSSLESSGGVTTGSSKTQNSFTKDLERSIKLLNTVLQRHNDDSNLKKKLVKDVVQKLLKTRYRDDESTTDFLSGLSFSSKRLGLDPRDSKNYTTTSTSDTNNSTEKSVRPKKSILRMEKFNANAIASTSQSAPNLPLVSNSEKPVSTSLNPPLATSHTESDLSSKGKDSSDTPFLKTSSEELYQKYKEAVKREEAYKRHLRDKEKFLKQKLVGSDSALKTTAQPQPNNQSIRLKELMNDLARNNYDDGSGDASKLEGGSITSNKPIDKIIDIGKLRSHSVFTLSSENSDKKNTAIERENRKINLRKRLQDEIAGSSRDQGTSKECHCGCGSSQVTNQCCVTDSSVQVDICGRQHSSSSNDNSIPKSNRTQTKEVIDSTNIQQVQKEDASSEIKYVCLCTSKRGLPPTAPENFMLYKCSRMTNHCLQTVKNQSKTSNNVSVQCYGGICSSSASTPRSLACSSKDREIIDIYPGKHLRVGDDVTRMSQTSQTNMILNISGRRPSERSLGSNSTDSRHSNKMTPRCEFEPGVPEHSERTQISNLIIHEITRSIQTEISINPRIPDPSLSDINIISDSECVKAISENYREVSKQTIQECGKKLQGRKNSETQMYAASVGSFGLTPRAFDSQEDLSLQLTHVKKQNVGVQSINSEHGNLQDVARQDENTDSYTIPLQGTNMTLKVSIGSKKRQPIPVIKDNVSHNQGPDQSDQLEREEKGTSMLQEYSQGVKSPRPDVYYSLLNTGEENIVSSRVINSSRIQRTQITINRKKYSDNASGVETPKYSTYPAVERKPFLRTYTDAGILQKKEYDEYGSLKDQDTYKNCCAHSGTGANQAQTKVDKKKYIVDSDGEIQKSKCGTFPTKERKQFLRTNTDVGILENNEFRKLSDSISFQDANTQVDLGPMTAKANQTNSNSNEPPPASGKCTNQKENTESINKNEAIILRDLRIDENTKKPHYDALPNNPERRSDAIRSTKPGDDNCVSCNAKNTEPNTALEGNPFSSIRKSTKPGDDTCASCTCNANKEKNKEPKTSLTSDYTFGGSCNKQNIESRELKKSEKRNDSCKICNAGAELSHSSNNKDDSDAKKDEKKCNYSENNNFTVNSVSTKEGKPFSIVEKSTKSGDDTCASCSTNKDKKTEPITSPKTDYTFGCCNQINTEPRELTKSEKRNDTCKTCNAEAGPSHSSYRKDDSDAINDEKKRKYSEDKNFTDDSASTKDPILEAIRNITSRYSKKDLEKGKKKKCFKEIMTVLNYLLDTDVTDDTDQDVKQCTSCSESANKQNKSVKIDEVKKQNANKKNKPCAPLPSKIKQTTDTGTCFSPKKLIDKAIQLSQKRSRQKKLCCSESSDLPTSSDIHETSTDRDCKILNKIKKECEKYHQKRCKSCHHDKKCESSSCTSVECDECKKTHHCHCRVVHKCKGYRQKATCERVKKKCVAYNLIIQTSDSLVSEENANEKNKNLQDIIVKVPSRRNNCIPETVKIRECQPRPPSPCRTSNRSRSLPNESEISSTDDYKRAQSLTVRQYLEKNRPDFIEKTSDRVNCLKMISESRANQRAAKRELLSLQLQRSSALNTISSRDLILLAKELGYETRRRRLAPKFISERDMKKHSERIYRSLPEVQQKKEDVRKENVKKTNLLMASMFKKSLQKKTLRGTVNLSNYTPVVKI